VNLPNFSVMTDDQLRTFWAMVRLNYIHHHACVNIVGERPDACEVVDTLAAIAINVSGHRTVNAPDYTPPEWATGVNKDAYRYAVESHLEDLPEDVRNALPPWE
jgi:hypothetical protein